MSTSAQTDEKEKSQNKTTLQSEPSTPLNSSTGVGYTSMNADKISHVLVPLINQESLTYSDKKTMITLVRLQSKLFPWLDHLSLKLFDFLSKHSLGGCCRVDTTSLDGDDDVTVVLQEVVGVQTNDTCLIGLSD
jgi:hypothetical protein